MAKQDLDDPHAENVTPPMPEMGSDSAFTATPLIAPPVLAPVEENTVAANPTFIQNQISLQRAPSTPKSTANALARNLSVRSNASYRSNGSYDAGLSRSAILSVLAHSDDPVRGREPTDSDSSIAESSGSCKLSKSNSDRSVKSVRSVAHIGPLPIGSLRCDSPPPRGLTYDCLKEGDVLIVADLEPGCIFAYDMKTFLVRPEDTFLGIKQIPFGSHFIWGGSDQGSSRVGFWIMASSRASNEFGEVHVRRWNKYDECLSEEVVAAEVRIKAKEVPSVYEDLRPYSNDSQALTHTAAAPRQNPHDATLWSRLTGSIKGSLLSRITGQKWNHWKISSSDDYRDRKPVINGEPQEENGQDSVFDFVVPRQTHTWSKDSVGRDRTEQAMDTSSHIQAIISDICKYEDSDYIIGEMQFCYITGMSLGNIVCQEHWAHIIRIVFRAYRLVLVLPKFMRKIIDALHAQLIYDEVFDGSIFDHAAKLDDDLKITLTTFKSRLTEQLLAQGNYLTDEQSAVGKAFEELESFLWKWNWDLRGNYVRSGQVQLEDGEFVDAELNDFEAEDERGEFAPVVVDIDEDGRERGLVRF